MNRNYMPYKPIADAYFILRELVQNPQERDFAASDENDPFYSYHKMKSFINKVISDTIDLADSRLSIIFMMNGSSCMSDPFTKGLFYVENNTIEDWRKTLADAPWNEIMREFYGFLLESTYDEENQNNEAFKRFVLKSELDETLKFKVLFAFDNYRQLCGYFTRIVEKAAAIITDVLASVKYVPDTEKLEAMLEKDYDGFFKLYCGISAGDAREHYIYPSISTGMYMVAPSASPWACIYILPELKEMIDYKRRTFRHVDVLQDSVKALADETKLSILRLLTKERLYGSQLAGRLGLSTATISYHTAQLAELGLLTAEKVNNKTFYSTNSETVREICRRIELLLS